MRILPALLLATLALALTPRPSPAGLDTTSRLEKALAERLARARLPQGSYGVAVLTRGSRPRIVFADGQTRPLIPASVAKILTAATALDLLGPAHVFTTRVTARGVTNARGELEGDLVVHGTGDPNLSGRFHDGNPTHLLEAFAQAVRESGIRRVTGALVLDDGPFDRMATHPSWTSSDRGRWYGAGVAGLAFNDGCADLLVRGASGAGVPAAVEVPSTLGVWTLDNRVKTVATGRPVVGGLWVRRGSTLRVQGQIAKDGRYRFSHPVPDPLLFFGGAFLEVLRRHDVTVVAGCRPARDGRDRHPGARVIAQFGSPLGPTLDVMNTRSQNYYASLIFKVCGARLTGVGSWETGSRAVSEMLRRRGLDADRNTRIVDGSGLSKKNRTTAATLTRLLASFEEDLLRGPALYGSLAVPGQEGTLRRRLKTHGLEARLHAKTGTLGRSGVHALAGYVDGVGKHPGYAFAILLNTHKGGRALIDDLVLEIARR